MLKRYQISVTSPGLLAFMEHNTGATEVVGLAQDTKLLHEYEILLSSLKQPQVSQATNA